MSRHSAAAQVNVSAPATTALDLVAPITATTELADSVSCVGNIQVHSALAQEAIRASIKVAVSEIHCKYEDISAERAKVDTKLRKLMSARADKLNKEKLAFDLAVTRWIDKARDSLFKLFVPRERATLAGAPFAFSSPAVDKEDVEARDRQARNSFGLQFSSTYADADGSECRADDACTLFGTLVITYQRVVMASYVCSTKVSTDVRNLRKDIAKLSEECEQFARDLDALLEGQRHIEDQESYLLAASTRAHFAMDAGTREIMSQVDGAVRAKIATGPAAGLMRGLKIKS